MPKNINFELKDSFEIPLKKRIGGNWRTGYKYQTDITLIPTYELGYIFGTFLGDGSSHTAKLDNNSNIGSVRWYFGKNEMEIAEKLADCIKKAFNKELEIYYEKKIILSILYHKPLAEFLKSFSKKTNKHLPTEYLVNNKEYLKGLLDGMIDSDGEIEDYGRIRFTNTSKKLIELFNVVCYLVKGFFPNNLKQEIKIGGLKNANIENFHQSYRADINTTGAKRLTKNYQAVKLLESEPTEIETKVYDLEIDCPTHSFIANNAIVHNSICVTRIVAGAGVPQLTAVMDCVRVAKDYGIPIIADGGIQKSGDLVKAIAAGASSVMIGSLFAGTDESPGIPITKNGQKYKIIRGMASLEAAMVRSKKEGKIEKEFDQVVPEGVEATVPYRGSVKDLITQLVGGLRSGMSYCGSKSIPEMWQKAEFIKITSSGWKESNAHDVDLR
ncbi:IMP dehydrogenase [Candidatus Woesearchaeota archaeon]|nr:IMP dehydrogenase [Candidatus Woesearchaeota archaeon]